MVFYFFSTGKEIQPLQVNPLFYYFQDTYWQKTKKLRGMKPFFFEIKARIRKPWTCSFCVRYSKIYLEKVVCLKTLPFLKDFSFV